MTEVVCEILKDSLLMGNFSVISSNGKFIASTQVSRLILRDLSKVSQILNVFQCLDKIDRIEFSPDSLYILCGLYARSTIQVFSVTDFEWKCRINEGVAGMVSVSWAPDSRTIISESDFGICLSLWSLSEEKHSIISFPKPSHKGVKSQYFAFSDDQQHLAVIHRIELQDQIGIYSLHPLCELLKFKSKSYDISMVQWTPKDSNIVTMDSPLHYAFCVYSPTGELLTMYEAYQNALGMRTFSCFNNIDRITKMNAAIEDDMSEKGDFRSSIINPLESSKAYIALGSFDGKIRIMTMYTWILAYELPLVHPKEMNIGMYSEDFKTKVEVSAHEFMGMGRSIKDNLFEGGGVDDSSTAGSRTLFTKTESILPNSTVYVEKMVKLLPKVPIDPRGNPKASNSLPAMGVSWLGWSSDGKYLAATEESQPRCLWIWEPNSSKLVELLIQLESIMCAQWRPELPSEGLPRNRENILAFCVGTNSLYLWSDVRGLLKYDNLFSGNDQSTFTIVNLRWNKTGTSILLKGKDSFAVCNFSLKDR